jgi:hypothetical protein
MVHACSFVFAVFTLIVMSSSCSIPQNTITPAQPPIASASSHNGQNNDEPQSQFSFMPDVFIIANGDGDSHSMNIGKIRSVCTDFSITRGNEHVDSKRIPVPDKQLDLLLDQLSKYPIIMDMTKNPRRLNYNGDYNSSIWRLEMTFPYEEKIEIMINKENILCIWMYYETASFMPPGLSVKLSDDEAKKLNELFSSCFSARSENP